MSNDLLTYSLEDNVALVTMNDGKANALSEGMIDALVGALERAEKEAGALVLAGRPDRFCAGFDLRVMMSSPDAARSLLRRGFDLLMKLYGAPLPLVIACTGHALAGGALVVLTGDVRIGALGPYRIGLNEVSIGLPVPILAMEFARDRLATSELVRATLMSQIYGPEDAVAAGYLDEVVAPDTVLVRAKEEAKRLGSLSRPAFLGSKTRLRAKTLQYVASTLEEEMTTFLPPA